MLQINHSLYMPVARVKSHEGQKAADQGGQTFFCKQKTS